MKIIKFLKSNWQLIKLIIIINKCKSNSLNNKSNLCNNSKTKAKIKLMPVLVAIKNSFNTYTEKASTWLANKVKSIIKTLK